MNAWIISSTPQGVCHLSGLVRNKRTQLIQRSLHAYSVMCLSQISDMKLMKSLFSVINKERQNACTHSLSSCSPHTLKLQGKLQ